MKMRKREKGENREPGLCREHRETQSTGVESEIMEEKVASFQKSGGNLNENYHR